ncbi:hypothetical protein K1719_035011 [Acacia pycnantha]|nr:hypothetical protein K1719_035011 [Acacia pycnantha]
MAIPAETIPTQTPSSSPSRSHPPPPPVPKLPFGIIWREEVSIQLSNAIALPESFLSSAKYDPPHLQELSNIEQDLLKGSGLARALITLNDKYATCEHTKVEAQRQLQVAEVARDQTSIEVQKIKEDLEKEREALRKTNGDFDQLLKESAMDKKILEKSRSEAEKYVSELNQLQIEMDSTRESLVEKDEAIKNSVAESLENALKQIRLLTPTLLSTPLGWIACLGSWAVR